MAIRWEPKHPSPINKFDAQFKNHELGVYGTGKEKYFGFRVAFPSNPSTVFFIDGKDGISKRVVSHEGKLEYLPDLTPAEFKNLETILVKAYKETKSSKPSASAGNVAGAEHVLRILRLCGTYFQGVKKTRQ